MDTLMVLMVMRVVTLSQAAIQNQPYACHLVNTSASPTCWSGICAEQKRVREAEPCFTPVTIPLLKLFHSVCSRGRGGAEEKRSC